jgi:hypothetical protein
MTISATFVLLLGTTGCMRRNGRNSDCRWPGEDVKNTPDARHLSADAEFAEDLAIRYGDTHYGLRSGHFVSGEAYGAAIQQCGQKLFEEIAKEHGVPVEQVSRSLGRNRARIDTVEGLSFALLYFFVSVAMARMIWRRWPPEQGWIPGVVMALFLSLVFAACATALGELWSLEAENIRIGTGHMSYRALRLPWARHRTEIFAGAAVLFWMVVGAAARPSRRLPRTPDEKSVTAI